MGTQTRQLEEWSGAFGNEYVTRNAATNEAVCLRTRAWAKILSHLEGDPPRSFFEVGCNVGINQRAIQRLVQAEHFAIEPNAEARATVLADGVIPAANLKEGDASHLPFPDGCADLAFTSGVLIHIAPENLDQACRELYRVSRKYILCSEYFSHTPESIPYRGKNDLLFKRDFGSHWLSLYPKLQHIANGFHWQPITGIDNVNWWLFKKA